MKHEHALRRAPSANGPAYDFTGLWINELSSQMSIVSQEGAQLSGTYTSFVSEGGEPVTGQLAGWANGLLISVTVNWAPSGAITSWVGQLVDPDSADMTIETLWQMTQAIENPDQPDELWQSILAGADSFHRG